MTIDDLDKLERLERGATPGPWRHSHTDDDHCMSMVVVTTDVEINDRGHPDDCKFVVAATLVQAPRYVDVADQKWDENAALIAEMRNALPELMRLARVGLQAGA